jgi:hypothetical protein
MKRVEENHNSNPTMTAHELTRFISKTLFNSNGCIIWKGQLDKDGYGRFKFKGKTQVAHRVSYLHSNPIPEGLQLDHLCRNPSCVNPIHLEPVTSKENLRRSPIHIESATRTIKSIPKEIRIANLKKAGLI